MSDLLEEADQYRHPDFDSDCEKLVVRLADRIEALEAALGELADLMDDVREGTYKPDSFTTQPARAALAPEQEK
jgi:hypothetical protein